MAGAVQHFVQDLRNKNEETRFAAALALQQYINTGTTHSPSLLIVANLVCLSYN